MPEGSVERAGSWLHAGHLPGALLLVTESPRCVGLGGLPEAGHAPWAVTGGVGRGRQSTGSGPAEAMSLIFSGFGRIGDKRDKDHSHKREKTVQIINFCCCCCSP